VRDDNKCLCGNGIVDDGEQCDWAMSAQKDCCSQDCTGCLCGNSVIDPGEQCDYGLPAQLECCDSQCQGCTCGNGRLDEAEECDPSVPTTEGQPPVCCQANCTACGVIITSGKKSVLPAVIGGGVLACAMIMAAILVIWWRADATSYSSVTTSTETETFIGSANNNPVYNEKTINSNPLYQYD